MKKPAKYFNEDQFVDQILKEMNLLEVDDKTLEDLRFEIKGLVNERVIATLIAKFTDKELFLLENLLKDHPELDEIDAITIIAENLPGLDELILKTVDDLAEELLEDSQKIDSKLVK